MKKILFTPVLIVLISFSINAQNGKKVGKSKGIIEHNGILLTFNSANTSYSTMFLNVEDMQIYSALDVMNNPNVGDVGLFWTPNTVYSFGAPN